MHITRRHALLSASALIPAALLAACGQPLTPLTVVNDIGTGLTALLNALNLVPSGLIPAATEAQVASNIKLAQSADAELSANLPVKAGATTAQTVIGYINAAFAVLAGPPVNGLIPAPFNLAVAAFDVVLTSVVEPFIGSVLGTTASASLASAEVRSAARASVPAMTLADARTQLRILAAVH